MINERFESLLKNKNQEFTHKNLKENLKIVIENTNFSEKNEILEVVKKESSDLMDYGDLVEMEESNLMPVIEEQYTNSKEKIEEGHIDIDNEEDDDEIEFHVNLDKVPPTLQNTILNEKIYLNESLKYETTSTKQLDLITEEDLKSLYESLNLDETCFISQQDSISPSTIQINNNLFRKDALHLYGVDELSTNEIFSYFNDYKPMAVEWIDDSSCNVVWKVENHALNAIVGMSLPYNEDDDNLHNDKDQTIKSIRKPPQGTKWRIGAKSIKGYHIYMRFVRIKSDKKRKGAESRSKYYVKYGNPNFGNLKGLISNSKRKLMKESQLNNAVADLSDLFDETPKSPKINENESRKLISYNIDDFAAKEDIEEFGTESLFSRSIQERVFTVLPKDAEKKSKANLKRKKMHMYSDKLSDSESHSSEEEEFSSSLKKPNHNYNTSTSPKNSSTFVASKKNDRVSLKDRLSGFGTTKNTSQSDYNSNLYARDRHFGHNNHNGNHRNFERDRNLYGRSKYHEGNRKNRSRSRSIVDSKFSRDKKPESDDSSNGSDLSDTNEEHKKRLNSFVSTSTIAKKRLSKI